MPGILKPAGKVLATQVWEKLKSLAGSRFENA